jgi:hypothetical protein
LRKNQKKYCENRLPGAKICGAEGTKTEKNPNIS